LTVQKIESHIKKVPDTIPTTVVVVIITDGHENSSKYFTLENIKQTIARLEKIGKWTFSFLGADIDAVSVAKDLAINQKNSFSFAKATMKNAVWDKLSFSMNNYVDKKQKNISTDNLFED